MSESIISEADPEKSIRTQERLSAMIESLGEEDHDLNLQDQDDDDLHSLSSSDSSDQFEPLRPIPHLDNQSIHTPPDQKLPSSSSNSMETDNKAISNNSNNIPDKQQEQEQQQVEFALPPHILHSVGASPTSNQTRSDSNNNNRFSMMSDYSGVIHEGTEISYVVKNQEPESIKTHSSSSSEPVIQNDVVIKQIKNAKAVSRFNSLHSAADTPSKPPKANLKYHSDPLLLIHDATKDKLTQMSVDSSLPTIRNGNEVTPSDDTFSIQSSVIPPLATTTTTSQDKFIEPTSFEVNNNNIPTVPPRNKNRPRTIIFDEDVSSSLSQQSPSSPKRSPRRQKQSHHSPEYNKNKEFNVHTISQLLSMTNGTLIGSEFQDLPIPIEEKRSLERLVDSLSRLTADMVLDPERYEEGLTRLKRAIRALEGFK